MSSSKNPTTRLGLQTLENREMPATALVASLNTATKVLTVNGSPGDDQINVRFTNNTVQVLDRVTSSTVPIRINNNAGRTVQSVARKDIGDFTNSTNTAGVQVFGKAGNDVIYISEDAANPAKRVLLDGGGESDTLLGGTAKDFLFGGAGDDTIFVGIRDLADGGSGSDRVAVKFQSGAFLTNDRFQPTASAADSARLANFEKAYAETTAVQGTFRAAGFSGEVMLTKTGSYAITVPHGVDLNFNFPALSAAIAQKYTALGGPQGILGKPVGSQVKVNALYSYVTFENGVITYSPGNGAHYMTNGRILTTWKNSGGVKGTYGLLTADEVRIGTYERSAAFQRGTLHVVSRLGLIREVHGAIYQRYASLGGAAGFLGKPLTSETATPDGVGRFNRFQNGMIYWSPATGAHVVYGAILEKYASKGYEANSELGYPISGEMEAPGGGRVSHFQRGDIYWSPATGAHIVAGQYLTKFNRYGGITTFGYPTRDAYYQPYYGGGYGHTVDFQRGYIGTNKNFKNEWRVAMQLPAAPYWYHFEDWSARW